MYSVVYDIDPLRNPQGYRRRVVLTSVRTKAAAQKIVAVFQKVAKSHKYYIVKW